MRYALFLLVLLGAVSAPAAQTLAWETVGAEESRPTGPLILRPDGTLLGNGFRWHPDGYVDYGLLQISPPYGPGQHWTRPHPRDSDARQAAIISFHPDTLFTYSGSTSRSTDGGVTFDPLPPPATCGPAPVEIPAGLPHAGRLVCGASLDRYATHSDDRGDSWSVAASPGSTPSASVGHLVVLPAGPRAGRLVAGGDWGLAASDDGGTTWQPTALWDFGRLRTNGLGVLRGGVPSGGDRVLAVVNGADYPGNRLVMSDDDGDSWTEAWQFPDNPTSHYLADLGGGSALAVSEFGEVFETADGGESWLKVGVVPHSLLDPESENTSGRVKWVWLGPDGRLYVGGLRLALGESVNRGYTWRTTESVAVASGEAAPESGTLGVAVRPNPSAGGAVTVELAGEGAVRAMVVDAVGRTVAELYTGELRGVRTIELDTSAWAAGVYTVVVEAEGARRAEAFTVAQ